SAEGGSASRRRRGSPLAAGGKDFYFDSGIMTAIKIINAVSRLPYSLANFVDLLPQHYQSGEISVKRQASGVRLRELLEKIEKNYRKDALKISHTDGLTMEFEDWWLNIRLSNTELVIRLNIEAESKGVLQKEKKKLLTIIN
ncbi:MAG: hypothetical protein AAB516_02115, partial [Patescibacteria group bacterium]